MTKGDNVLIKYTRNDNKTILATYLETANGVHLFEDIHGIFGVSANAVKTKRITLEIV